MSAQPQRPHQSPPLPTSDTISTSSPRAPSSPRPSPPRKGDTANFLLHRPRRRERFLCLRLIPLLRRWSSMTSGPGSARPLPLLASLPTQRSRRTIPTLPTWTTAEHPRTSALAPLPHPSLPNPSLSAPPPTSISTSLPPTPFAPLHRSTSQLSFQPSRLPQPTHLLPATGAPSMSGERASQQRRARIVLGRRRRGLRRSR